MGRRIFWVRRSTIYEAWELSSQKPWVLVTNLLWFCCQVMSNSWRLRGLRYFTISWSLPKFMFIESVMPSNHLIFWCLLLFLPSIFPSIRVFFNESALCIRWPKYWSFSFSISPSNEYSELISFKIDWFDLLAAQGILKSLLQHHSSKASILQHSAFFRAQLSLDYTWLLENPEPWLYGPLLAKWCLCFLIHCLGLS